ncbi:hypothetical protein [Polaribacter atrinae]|uniref:Uncharacterized protein n=1 Tax=Polaribacter atrinae TaxID=1333662 RepID=A0A176TBD0_9FLAO|nr:hypothetical protein [Polaribacter atrinae]OAD44716.1 hypothetical protein LPB303_11180 [Polaribacter atrinae]
MTYPKNIIFILVLFVSIALNAQIQVNLNVSSNPTPELFEWANRTDLAILTVTNSDERLIGTDYKIKVKVSLDNELVLETNMGVMTQKLPLGSQTFLADEIIPYDAINFKNNSFKNKMIQTGLLPAGVYTFCVSLIDLNGKTISTPAEVCRTMLITAYQLPELLFPIDNFSITASLAPTILFTWSPVSPTPPAQLGVKYIIAITEVQPGQSVSQAFHVNYPIIEEEVIGRTQFNWPLDLNTPDETTQYVWSIKPVTFNDNPYKSGVNGFSYIETFTLKVEDKNIEIEEEQVDSTSLSEETENAVLLIDEKADINEMTERIVSLTTNTKSDNSLSIKEQNINYATIKDISQKLVLIKNKNAENNISEKEKKEQLADIKAMAESLVNLTIKSNPEEIIKKDKLADIKAMAEELVNLTVKN